jgi:iron complex transport system substrate-binding protein
MQKIRMSKKYLIHFLFVSLLWNCQSNKKEPNNVKNAKLTDTIVSVTTTEVSIESKDYQRIVAIDPTITEILIALKVGNRLVAVDQSLPTDTNLRLPKVGFKNTLRVEHIVEHKPEVVFSDIEGSPKSIIKQVKEKNIDYFTFEKPIDIETTKDLVTKLGKHLGREKSADKIILQMDSCLNVITKFRKNRKDTIRVLHLHIIPPETVLISGVDTPIEQVLQMAGAQNAVDFFDGMLRASVETIQEANPDVILMSTQALETMGGIEQMYNLPAVFESAAFQSGRIVTLDEFRLLNFGIYTPKTALELSRKLYGY